MKNAKDRYGAEEYCQMLPYERLKVEISPEMHDTWILNRQELLIILDHAEREYERSLKQ